VRSGILKDKSGVLKHVISLAASIAVHAAILYLLAVHFVSVKFIDFGPPVTEVVIAPPPSGILRLPGVGGLPGNLPAVDLDFQDTIPRRPRAPLAPTPVPEEEAEFYSRRPVDPRLTSGFRLDQGAPEKPGPASGAGLRLPIAERGGGVTGGAAGYIPPRRAGDLRRYLYSGQAGTGGAYGGVSSGGGQGRTGQRGRPQVSSSVKSYDLSPWARTVIELVQKKWTVPPAAGSKTDENVEISVVVLKSGGLSAIVVVTPSDDRLFNQSAQDAIEESLPFPPLPDDFPEPSLELYFVFSRQ
jgi:TonB family protein